MSVSLHGRGVWSWCIILARPVQLLSQSHSHVFPSHQHSSLNPSPIQCTLTIIQHSLIQSHRVQVIADPSDTAPVQSWLLTTFTSPITVSTMHVQQRAHAVRAHRIRLRFSDDSTADLQLRNSPHAEAPSVPPSPSIPCCHPLSRMCLSPRSTRCPSPSSHPTSSSECSLCTTPAPRSTGLAPATPHSVSSLLPPSVSPPLHRASTGYPSSPSEPLRDFGFSSLGYFTCEGSEVPTAAMHHPVNT